MPSTAIGAAVVSTLLVLAPVGALLTAGPAGAAPQELTLTAPELTDRVLTVHATVPGAIADRPAPEGAFTGVQDGRPVALSADRVLDGDVELLLVLDGSDVAGRRDAVQAAAADLLRAVPPTLPTRLLPGGTTTVPAREAVTRLAELPATDGLLAVPPGPASGRRLSVVVAACPAVAAVAAPSPFAGDLSVSVLALGDGCQAAAADLGAGRPGIVRTGLDPLGLLTGVDDVGRDLAGQYVLVSEPLVEPGPLEVTVRIGTAVAAASVQVPGTPSGSGSSGARDPRAGGSDDEASFGVLLLASLLAAAAAVGVGLELVRRRTPV